MGSAGEPAIARSPVELLSTVPHRFFFLTGVTSLALAALW